MKGFFDLRSPENLREKLRRDLARLQDEPMSVDAAFNFFVTAEHMLDWAYPIQEPKRKSERQASVLLQICSHLANGAKHFELSAKHHKSVASTDTQSSGYDHAGYLGDFSATSYQGIRETLVVSLKDEAAALYGSTVEVVVLARMVMEFWEAHPLTAS